jgi:hypothetical protein
MKASMKTLFKSIINLVFRGSFQLYHFFAQHLVKVSAHALGWIAIVMLHFSSVPTLWAVLLGQSDKLPNIDLMIFIWSALTTLFVKAILEKDRLYVTTIAIGFVGQTMLMGLILFK